MSTTTPKTFFITGCSSGFGKIFATRLLHQGHHVVATARGQSTLDELKHIAQNEHQLLVLPLDVTKPEQVKAAVQAAEAKFGRIDVLINNAGYGLFGAFEECSTGEIERLFETNVYGVMNVTREILPIMRRQKHGTIVQMSSIAGLTAVPGFGLYNASKWALEGFSEALAGEVVSFGIRVMIVEPGPFRTEFLGRSLSDSPPLETYREVLAQMRSYMESSNGKQPGDPEKACDIIIAQAQSDKPPLRLLLGSVAQERFEARVKVYEALVTNGAALARSADYAS